LVFLEFTVTEFSIPGIYFGPGTFCSWNLISRNFLATI